MYKVIVKNIETGSISETGYVFCDMENCMLFTQEFSKDFEFIIEKSKKRKLQT